MKRRDRDKGAYLELGFVCFAIDLNTKPAVVGSDGIFRSDNITVVTVLVQALQMVHGTVDLDDLRARETGLLEQPFDLRRVDKRFETSLGSVIVEDLEANMRICVGCTLVSGRR
jgi:hypothetical protein